MKIKNKITKNKHLPWKLFPLVFLLFLPSVAFCQTFKELPKPNIYIKGVPRTDLTLVKEIEPDFDENLFYASPVNIDVSKSGHIFIYDLKLGKLMIFDNKFKFVKQVLSVGQGPFETPSPNNKDIYAAPDGGVWLHDGIGDKIMKWSYEGLPLFEKKLNRRHVTMSPFRPVIDQNGFLYTFSIHEGIVDCYDKNFQFVRSYLTPAANDAFIYYRPNFEPYYKNHWTQKQKEKKSKPWLSPSSFKNFYDVTADGQLFIFIHRSATAYFFNKEKLVRKFDVLIDRVLMQFKESMVRKIKDRKKMIPPIKIPIESRIFASVFLDKDANFIFLQYLPGDKECTLYQLDFTGKLIHIYSYGQQLVRIIAKRNNLFYGLTSGEHHPIILKIKKENTK